MTAILVCPFCHAEKLAQAPVCPACHRDTLPPPGLVRERDELLRHRADLTTELAAKMQRLSAR